jgi:uncharacterized protein YdeI (YjbR/CyaY-like superfamily)
MKIHLALVSPNDMNCVVFCGNIDACAFEKVIEMLQVDDETFLQQQTPQSRYTTVYDMP